MEKKAMKLLWILACAAFTSTGLFIVTAWLPEKSEGTDMPGTIVIKYIQKRYGQVTFDHAMHVDLAGSCGKCHHMHDEKRNATCRECHSLDASMFKASAKQGFLPCSGCHTDYSAETPEIPGLKVALHKKCFECHIGIGEIGSSPQGCVKTCHVRK